MRLLYLFFLVSPLWALATGQAPDRLIWQGDTLSLYAAPLNSHPTFNKFSKTLFGTQKAPFNTGCWRGHIAEWEIQHDTLFLVNIYTCDYPSNKTKADLNTLFPNQLIRGKLPASWLSAPLLIPKGKLLYYTQSYIAIHEKEIELTLKNGFVTHYQEFDNSKTQLSVYAEKNDSLLNYVYSHINWQLLPNLSKPVKVFAEIVSGARPFPDTIRLLKKSNQAVFDDEALRVLTSIPSWSCYYKRGVPYPIGYYFVVIFDENHRKKYAKP